MVKIMQAVTLALWLLPFSLTDHNAIIGVWRTPNKDGAVEIYKVNNQYNGKLISYTEPGATDANNPSPSLRSRKVIGIDIFQNFVYDKKNGRWVGGTIYDPESGKSYSCSIWLNKDNPKQLQARGYLLGMELFGRTETFTRVR
ncbi:DUF2147 domain-containing protein [Pontibacter harenae]|uniref:DUF2147 domain-containing protein n=1 Tax=Pontibacter harenae TaxID=2894083 RepID=UPI001E4998B9|nr:DUF2147 domain-containing protein [Pontibacter harenae]MCC9168421.1 DUF2147 domain-containing protein [Pontibacter harenae]